MKAKKIITEDFFIGNLGNDEIPNEILNSYKEYTGTYVDEVTQLDIKADDKIHQTKDGKKLLEDRKCYACFMNVDEPNFISEGIHKIFHNVNDMMWKMDLIDWANHIQFTKYLGKGSHYGWHSDQDDNLNPIGARKLSFVYSLSKKSDYVGGEFQIKTNSGKNYTIKFDLGDFIVFPSKKLHRVKPLKSGTRITMVAWYR